MSERLYEVTVTFTARTRSYSIAGAVADGAQIAGAVADGAQMVSDWLDRTEVLSIESKAVPLPVEPDDLIAELPTDEGAPAPVTTPVEDEYDPFADDWTTPGVSA
mgnify:FL=1